MYNGDDEGSPYSLYAGSQGGEADDDGGQGGDMLDYAYGLLDMLKANWVVVVALLVFLGGAYMAYDFLVLSVKDVEIGVSDTEGQPLGIVSIKIADSAGSVAASASGSGTVRLRAGQYTLAAGRQGYKTKNIPLYVRDNMAVQVKLEKDLDMKISLDNFPEKLVVGENRTLNLVVQNTGDKEIGAGDIEFVFSGALGEDYMSIEYAKTTVPAGGSETITLQISVREDINKKLIGDGKKGSIRARGLDNKDAEIDVNYALVKFDSGDVKINPSRASLREIDAGSSAYSTIEITNKNDFTMENVEISLGNVATDAEGNVPEEVREWIKADPSTISSIANGETRTFTVEVSIPQTAKKDKVKGIVLLKTAYWEKEFEVSFSVSEAEVSLEIGGISSTYSLSKDSETGLYEEKTGSLELKNSGDLAINNIELVTLCGTDWLSIPVKKFAEIPSGASEDVEFTVRAPITAEADTLKTCEVLVKYDDPVFPLAQGRIIKNINIQTR